MAILLKELYNSTKTKFQLTLLSNPETLNNPMSWVYVSEDYNTAEFLFGEELVITTGVTYYAREWLMTFITKMIEHKTSGLIINTGTYIFPEDIDEEMIAFCNEHNYPLFIMPWKIHIYDITRDYYNRIFIDNQISHTISDSLLKIIKNPDNIDAASITLGEKGFSDDTFFSVCTLSLPEEYAHLTLDSLDINTGALFSVKHFIHESKISCHLAIYKGQLLFILHNTSEDIINKSISSLEIHLKNTLKRSDWSEIRLGIGNTCQGFNELAKSYQHAVAAMVMAKYHQTMIFKYKNIGFAQLLLEIEDITLLNSYSKKYLGNIIDYDKEHNSYYLDTLYQYIIHDGSIQEVANALYCHRNTVNYRIRFLKEEFGLDLKDSIERFNLLSAFEILEYLKIINRAET